MTGEKKKKAMERHNHRTINKMITSVFYLSMLSRLLGVKSKFKKIPILINPTNDIFNNAFRI